MCSCEVLDEENRDFYLAARVMGTCSLTSVPLFEVGLCHIEVASIVGAFMYMRRDQLRE